MISLWLISEYNLGDVEVVRYKMIGLLLTPLNMMIRHYLLCSLVESFVVGLLNSITMQQHLSAM